MTRPTQRTASQRHATIRRIYTLNAVVLSVLALVGWRVIHKGHPQELRGTWAWEQASVGNQWSRSDTIWLGPGDVAVRKAHSIWHGPREMIDSGAIPDSLHLSGSYTLGVASSITGAKKLCLWYVGDAPPFGCFNLVVNGHTMTVGKAVFHRIAGSE
jgi:hypothetical protein